MNTVFVFSGNCRTFIECIDSACEHIVSKLFNTNVKIVLYLYLKITDPGGRNESGSNFNYTDVDCDKLVNKIKTLNYFIKRNALSL